MDNRTERSNRKHSKERRMYKRYQAIYSHLKGTSMTAIADILNRNRMTVSSYIHRTKTVDWQPCSSRTHLVLLLG
ncbi:helix-turn-helix domain-containing protein [Paenibacillus dendritiformis]|uniref:helix-turn-helix domain-containing protein n=1 Tax=Paenibacillus dendritiformis TaxID=130049 RepID=UPI0018CE2FB2